MVRCMITQPGVSNRVQVDALIELIIARFGLLDEAANVARVVASFHGLIRIFVGIKC